MATNKVAVVKPQPGEVELGIRARVRALRQHNAEKRARIEIEKKLKESASARTRLSGAFAPQSIDEFLVELSPDLLNEFIRLVALEVG